MLSKNIYDLRVTRLSWGYVHAMNQKQLEKTMDTMDKLDNLLSDFIQTSESEEERRYASSQLEIVRENLEMLDESNREWRLDEDKDYAEFLDDE